MEIKETGVPVTILMPAYNAEAYIGEAIESMLTQSHAHFEFLIIDDGSVDATVEIIRSYKDSRIRLVCHEQNKGLQYTLNEGIALSSHELIARMDADDISHPWRLEKQVAYMNMNPDCAMVASWVKIMDREKNFIRTEGPYSRHVYYTLTFECCIYHPTILFRKKEVQSIGGYTLEYAEDYDLFWRLSRAFRIHMLEEPLLWYRIHDKNTNTVTRKEEYEAFSRQVLERNFRYFLGSRVEVPEAYAACYRYEFDPLLKEPGPDNIRQCFAMLDKLYRRIIATENPNRDDAAIRYISRYKRMYILKGLAQRLPLLQMLRLVMAEEKQPALALSLLLKRIRGIFNFASG